MIDRWIGRIARGLELALALAFVAAILLNFTNVIARYVFARSILWADEAQVFVMIAITFFGFLIVTSRDGHLRMDVLARMAPPRVQGWLKALELVIFVAVCGLIFVQSQDYAGRMFDIGRMSDAGDVPMWIPHSFLAIGFGGAVLVMIWRGFRFITGRDKVDPPHTQTGAI
ncbi:MAG: tripartite ATP-independent periplasmic transporter DctQ [Hyphomicrobiales bacterium]|nr:tripartite ATP-independent periplasmic transporter DctQ [Hyphomicrobiales bacterium]